MAFTWVNVCCYVADKHTFTSFSSTGSVRKVGLHKLNSVDSRFESAWFQPLSLIK